MAKSRLKRLQRLPTPDGLHHLADDVEADPTEPEGLGGFLRAAAREIDLSRREIRRLEKKLKKET